MRNRLLSHVLILCGLIAFPVLAEDCEAPCLNFGITAKVQSDWVFSASPANGTGVDTGPGVDFELAYAPTERLTFTGTVTAEAVRDWTPGQTRTFKDVGAFVGELYAEFAADPVTFRLGKFDPEFGMASAQTDGLYAAGLSDVYDTDERWVAQAVLAFPGEELSQSLTANVFTTDRTALGRSVGIRREELSLSDGGAGNVKGIGSFAAFYDICSGGPADDCFGEGDFGGRLGVRYQKAGRATDEQGQNGIIPHAEQGYVGALNKRVPLGAETDLRLLGELAYFRNFEGGDEHALVGTASAAIDAGPVTYSTTYSRLLTLSNAGGTTTDQFVSLAARYDLGDIMTVPDQQQWTLDAGYGYAKNADGTHDHRVGLKFTIAFETSRLLR